MKRDKNLQELSRDHHYGLLLGWKIRQGIRYNADPDLMASYVTWFSSEALFSHFDEEENEVLTFLPDTDHYKQRTLEEHKKIRAAVSVISVKADPEKLLGMAALLDAHIRFEERELFPYMEQILDHDQLDKIGAAIARCHKPFAETFSHEFWKKPAN